MGFLENLSTEVSKNRSVSEPLPSVGKPDRNLVSYHAQLLELKVSVVGHVKQGA